jgi:hypothetical protein
MTSLNLWIEDIRGCELDDAPLGMDRRELHVNLAAAAP